MIYHYAAGLAHTGDSIFLMIKRLPIRLTVTTAFIISMAASISLVAFLNFSENTKEMKATAHQLIDNSVEIAEQHIERLVGRAEIIAETAGALPSSVLDWENPHELLIFLSAALKNEPDLYGVFVGFTDGAFVQVVNFLDAHGRSRNVRGIPTEAALGWRVIGPVGDIALRPQSWRFFDRKGFELDTKDFAAMATTSYDPRQRPWHKAALYKKTTTHSKMYMFSSLQAPGVTVSAPAHNLYNAVIGVDLPLSDLARMTKRLQPGKNGVIAIVDNDGGMIAHPDPKKIIQPLPGGAGFTILSVNDIDDSRVQGAMAARGKTSEATLEFTIDKARYVASFKSADAGRSLDWQIISVASIDDFTRRLAASLQRSILWAGVVFAISIIVVVILAGWISTPVIRLRRQADQITEMNLGAMEPISTPFDEILRLQDSMEHMRGALMTFLRYVPQDLVRELVRNGEAATLGGTRREVTILFTDIEGFTTLSESLTPEEVLAQTSMYFEQMSFTIQANRGTIDKFIGDAIMAMWNAPSEDDMHIDNACRGTLAAYHVSEDLNAELAAKNLPLMKTRFGVHTGEVLVGNMGARDRLQYTCLGANVNLAARIEGLNKYFGTQVLVSDSVRRKASNDFLFRRVDIVEAKGTSLPMTIYELMGERGEDAAFYVGAEKLRLASRYEAAFDLYLHRDFKSALSILEEIRPDAPEDGVLAALEEKCLDFLTNPPPDNWNGATAFDKK